jgi:hypothetical protein
MILRVKICIILTEWSTIYIQELHYSS